VCLCASILYYSPGHAILQKEIELAIVIHQAQPFLKTDPSPILFFSDIPFCSDSELFSVSIKFYRLFGHFSERARTYTSNAKISAPNDACYKIKPYDK